MAARRKYPEVHVQLRALALAARREGLTFEEFWDRAVRPGLPPVIWRTPPAARPHGCVIWPNDTATRQAERAITQDERVEAGWCRAYSRLDPLPQDRALPKLLAFLECTEAEEEPDGFADLEAVLSAA